VLEVTPLAGTWVDDTIDPPLELTLDATGSGTLLVGEASPLPPIEDAHTPYLVEVGESDITGFDRASRDSYSRYPRDGFRYTVIPGRGRASEMTLLVSLSEPWSEWCELQTPVRGANCYRCEFVADGGTAFSREPCEPGCFAIEGDALVPIHCGRFLLCAAGLDSVCECNANECFASRTQFFEATVTLDPVDPDVLRFAHNDVRYLVRAEP
jgi:hypothetical protein